MIPSSSVALNEHVIEIRKLARTTISNIVEIGRRLTECKKLAGHGNWLPWLEREFGWSESTALRFMRVYELGKSVTMTDLNLSVMTLYLLAAPSTSEKARTEIIKRAKAGEIITPTLVRSIRELDTARPPGIATVRTITAPIERKPLTVVAPYVVPDPVVPVSSELITALEAALALATRESSWEVELSRDKLRKRNKALRSVKLALFDLIDLAKPSKSKGKADPARPRVH
jgi:Protein of unknown function (DUF3102)